MIQVVKREARITDDVLSCTKDVEKLISNVRWKLFDDMNALGTILGGVKVEVLKDRDYFTVTIRAEALMELTETGLRVYQMSDKEIEA